MNAGDADTLDINGLRGLLADHERTIKKLSAELDRQERRAIDMAGERNALKFRAGSLELLLRDVRATVSYHDSDELGDCRCRWCKAIARVDVLLMDTGGVKSGAETSARAGNTPTAQAGSGNGKFESAPVSTMFDVLAGPQGIAAPEPCKACWLMAKDGRFTEPGLHTCAPRIFGPKEEKEVSALLAAVHKELLRWQQRRAL